MCNTRVSPSITSQIFAKRDFKQDTVQYLSQCTAVTLLVSSIEFQPLLIFSWPSTRAPYRATFFWSFSLFLNM